MTSTREILTLQFGNFANYVGAHWWNIQESGFVYDPDFEPSEVNNDILFREGKNFKGNVTYTPRLLSVDLQGSLNHLPENGFLYDEAIGGIHDVVRAKNLISWEKEKIDLIRKDPVPKPEFQKDLDNREVYFEDKSYNFVENVDTWTDFLYTRYHPRSINVIKKYQHSKERDAFDTFSNGAQFWQTDQYEDEFSDKIRQYVEECNNCQGFQTIFDCSNAFSGFSIKCLEHLNDEYSKTNFAIPVFSPISLLFESSDEALTDSIRVVNTALTYAHLIEQSSLFLPLSTQDRVWRQLGTQRQFPFLNYKSNNLYHSSAILASYLDTITLRYRIKNSSSSSYLSNFCSDLTNYGRKLTAAAFALPFKMRSDEDLIDCLNNFQGNMMESLSPNTKIGTNYIVQSVCVRGIPKIRLKRPMSSGLQQMKMAAYKCVSVSEMFQLYFQCENHASLADVLAIQSPHPIKTPYPQEIFDQRLDFHGFLLDNNRSIDKHILSVPAVASIQCSGDLADTIESLHREASRVKISKLHRFKETGLETDEYLEILENLLNFKDNYEDNYEL